MDTGFLKKKFGLHVPSCYYCNTWHMDNLDGLGDVPLILSSFTLQNHQLRIAAWWSGREFFVSAWESGKYEDAMKPIQATTDPKQIIRMLEEVLMIYSL